MIVAGFPSLYLHQAVCSVDIVEAGPRVSVPSSMRHSSRPIANVRGFPGLSRASAALVVASESHCKPAPWPAVPLFGLYLDGGGSASGSCLVTQCGWLQLGSPGTPESSRCTKDYAPARFADPTKKRVPTASPSHATPESLTFEQRSLFCSADTLYHHPIVYGYLGGAAQSGTKNGPRLATEAARAVHVDDLVYQDKRNLPGRTITNAPCWRTRSAQVD